MNYVGMVRNAITTPTLVKVPKFPNSRYLGMGYNVITGNPDSNLYDPGFRYSVLKFTWATNSMSSDGKYLVPDHIEALQTKSCSFESQASIEYGTRGYQNALSVDAGVSARVQSWFWSARFTASGGYRNVKQETSLNRRVYTSCKAKCIQYQLAVNYMHSAINVTSEFAQAVRALPLVRNNTAYIDFLSTYGTHFTSRVVMGAKMVIRSEFEEQAVTGMEEEGFNINIGAKLSFLKFSGALWVETNKEEKQREAFESKRRSYSASFLGSHPPRDGRWENWAETTANSPYPVRYTLVPIISLFSHKFFPDMPSNDLFARKVNLCTIPTAYCRGIPGECASPVPDRMPLRMKRVVSKFRFTVIVSCPPGYRVLSCGILSLERNDTAYDQGRWAIPKNGTQCFCQDSAGAACVSWCTATGVQYIANTTQGVGIVYASCPRDHKVLH